jgi:hypothetical protein
VCTPVFCSLSKMLNISCIKGGHIIGDVVMSLSRDGGTEVLTSVCQGVKAAGAKLYEAAFSRGRFLWIFRKSRTDKFRQFPSRLRLAESDVSFLESILGTYRFFLSPSFTQ